MECWLDISDRRRYARYCTEHGGDANTERRYQVAIKAARTGRTCAECGVDISERGGSALYCVEHGSSLATSHRYLAAAKAGRPAKACAECGAEITERRGNARYCAEHGGQTGTIARYRVVAQAASSLRSCAECGANIGERPPSAHYCVEHGGPAGTRRRYLATVRAHETAQTLRQSDGGRAALRSRAHSRRAAGNTENIAKLTEGGLRRIRGGETVLCGICEQPILDVDEFEIDHILPITKGGTHELENLQPAHAICNRRKGNRM